MGKFANAVFAAFECLQSEHRFLPARAVSGKHFASLVRQVSEDVFAYVFVHDGRPSDTNLSVDLWVAPPDIPDHSLESLYVGYKIRIGSEYDIADNFLLSCEKRIVHFLPCVERLCPYVRSELNDPGIRTNRWMVYQMERQLLSCFLLRFNRRDSLAVAAQDVASAAIRAASLESVENACQPVVVEMLAEGELDRQIVGVYGGNENSLASALAGHLYVRALGIASLAASEYSPRSR